MNISCKKDNNKDISNKYNEHINIEAQTKPDVDKEIVELFKNVSLS